MIIAIDGPAASGKGTLGKRLAAHFGLRHLDTGLLYLGHAGKPAAPSIEGSIDEQDFVARYAGKGEDRAVVTCNQDKAALKIEADWEASGNLDA